VGEALADDGVVKAAWSAVTHADTGTGDEGSHQQGSEDGTNDLQDNSGGDRQMSVTFAGENSQSRRHGSQMYGREWLGFSWTQGIAWHETQQTEHRAAGRQCDFFECTQ
jgi:hypothetical protein